MSLLECLPLLEGWWHRRYTFKELQVLRKGESKELFHFHDARGWLLGIDYVATDCYMQYLIETYAERHLVTPQAIHEFGLTLPPPMGTYETLYDRPDPARTEGTYAGSILTSAYPYPWKGDVRVAMRLGMESTQPAAAGNIGVTVLEVTDLEAFKRSFQELIGVPYIRRLTEELETLLKRGKV